MAIIVETNSQNIAMDYLKIPIYLKKLVRQFLIAFSGDFIFDLLGIRNKIGLRSHPLAYVVHHTILC